MLLTNKKNKKIKNKVWALGYRIQSSQKYFGPIVKIEFGTLDLALGPSVLFLFNSIFLNCSESPACFGIYIQAKCSVHTVSNT